MMEFEKLYRHAMTYGREHYQKAHDYLHPDGKPLMQTELTAEMLRKMGPEARQLLVERHPQEVMRALAEVQ